jgi:hypothetical protein
LDRDGINGIISEYIHGLIRIYNVCSVKDERAWDLFHDIMFLDPVTSQVFTIPDDQDALQEREFTFPGVVGCLPLIYEANV